MAACGVPGGAAACAASSSPRSRCSRCMSCPCCMLSFITFTTPMCSARAVKKKQSAMKWYPGPLPPPPASRLALRRSSQPASSSLDTPSLVSPLKSTRPSPMLTYAASSRCQALPDAGSTKGSHSLSSTTERLQKNAWVAAAWKSIRILARSALLEIACCIQSSIAPRVSLFFRRLCTAVCSPVCRMPLQLRRLWMLAMRSAWRRFSRSEKHCCCTSGCGTKAKGR
mmetsp:Transcript_4834/g.12112  ORF Transcript_4834/g.12112 Transcript_4834/m.12112 type:complete len:226 (+) Transcript_4834:1447-2124(+)